MSGIEGQHDPVEQWRAGGGRFHARKRRRIPPPAEVLPRWRRSLETAVRNPVARDAFLFGLGWTQVDVDAGVLRVEETKTGDPLEFPSPANSRKSSMAAAPRAAPSRRRAGHGCSRPGSAGPAISKGCST